MKISLSSASFAINVRNASALISRNSPGSATRPARKCARSGDQDNFTGELTGAIGHKHLLAGEPGIAMSSFPESTTKQGIPNSPGSKSTSPAWTDRTLP